MKNYVQKGGCSAPQIMAYSGHKNLKEVQTYIESANRLGLARQALQMQVTADEKRTRIVKPLSEVCQNEGYTLEK